MNERDEKDKILAFIDARASNILYCGLDAEEFNRISICKNVKDILLNPTHT